jgi:hypothetical protein
MRSSFFAVIATLALTLGVVATPISEVELAKRCVGGRDEFASLEEFEKRYAC